MALFLCLSVFHWSNVVGKGKVFQKEEGVQKKNKKGRWPYRGVIYRMGV